MVCSLHVSTKTGPTAILRCFMQPYSLTDLLLKKQRFLDTSVERLWNRTQTEDITLFPEGLTRIICGITWGRGKHGVNSDGTSCQSCHCQTEILRQSNDTQQRRVGKNGKNPGFQGWFYRSFCSTAIHCLKIPLYPDSTHSGSNIVRHRLTIIARACDLSSEAWATSQWID